MKKHALAVLAMASLWAAAAGAEDNPIAIVGGSGDALNVLSLSVAGHGNALVIEQTIPETAASANRMDVRIEGSGNGGPAGQAFEGVLSSSSLAPGALAQSGEGNLMKVGLLGDGNLFAALQSGHFNVLTASISGIGNQAAVQQFGNNNHAAFSQTGFHNSVSITQRSR